MTWGKPPTTIPLIEDHPRLARKTLVDAGALSPEKVTLWGWNTPTGALAIRVTGGAGAFTIADGTSEVRVVCRARYLVCPACGRLCRYLLFREGWHCQVCSGCDWASRHRFRTIPVMRRQRLLRQLVKRPVLDLRASELRYDLAKVDRAIIERIRDVHRRACSRRGR
jgi:hypothetical protein